jgi:ATP-dependent Lon protease
MSQLDVKINQHFPSLAVRKDLTKTIKGNAIVPSYVLEFLLGQHCATDDPATIEAGLDQVRRILAKHFVHRSESELVKSTIKEKGRHKIIDKITVELNDKGDVYEATFSNLGLRTVPVSSDYVKNHPKLLVGGVWCITDMVYEPSEDSKRTPWHIDQLKPIQVSTFNFDQYLQARAQFSTEEWMGVLMQSIGFNPEMFTRRGILVQLLRLVAFCERNYNLIELGPKGTGKSHIYSEFSPHGILISGGEVTTAKLFVNNASGRIGLVGYWDCICFDEFAGKDKKVDKNLVDIMKNYMANKSFSRGIESLGAEASMVFMGNTRHSVAYMLKQAHLFEELPDKYIDSAFLDRIHAYIPGWEVSPIQNDLFTNGYGLIVDYLAEILRHLRSEDFSQRYRKHIELSDDLTTRDRDGIQKTFSGLVKLLHPSGQCSIEEERELLHFSIECRKRVKDHILRLDDTFEPKHFSYKQLEGSSKEIAVKTAEEEQYPNLAIVRRAPDPASPGSIQVTATDIPQLSPSASAEGSAVPEAGKPLRSGEHVVVPENLKGYSYRRLFSAHLVGARKIAIYDPYIRTFWQIRNCLEFLQLVNALAPEGEEVHVDLLTQSDPEFCVQQDENLNRLVETMDGSKVTFSFDYDNLPTFHARSIQTDTGWKISLDRGLDLFQRYDMNALSLAAADQTERLTKGCEITYLLDSVEK